MQNAFDGVMLDINPSKKHLERILKIDKKIAGKFDYDGIEFRMQEKDFNKIEAKNNICINVFGYENEFFQFMLLIKNLKTL